MSKEWHIIPEGLIPQEGDLCAIEAGGKVLCLVHYQGKLFATQARCPHAGAFLADGYCDTKGNLVCPNHRYKFSVETGHNTSGEGYYLHRYPMRQRNGVWEVEVP